MRPLTNEQMMTMLLYYAQGMRAQDIAEVEHLSIHAVNNRLKRVKAVMKCDTTTQAVIKAVGNGDILVYRRVQDSPYGDKGELVVRLRNSAHETA